ncbi:MAG TPA: type II toxin-antitoxin system RelE/ParE family toxin [Chthonomonadaceae bacterium]|nr:type II toxin-antitoxin system RelE/ParE family toxin [Chthonomonadaceae bacterium]
MRKLDITRDAYKFVSDLQAKQYRQVVRKALSLLNEPQPQDAAQLVGYDYWRADIGEYRIVYTFDAETVYIALIAKRNDDEVYKKLARKSS